MGKIEKIEDLIVWQKARELAKKIYALTNKGKLSKDFALKDQIRRSSVSVASNIAEGFGRGGNKEFIQFLYMSKGSLYELRTQLYIALDLEYITQAEFSPLNAMIDETGKLINGLINYLQRSEFRGSKFKNRELKNQELRTTNQNA
ncbi:MAG: four helix bundle protein [Bacteroidota bacterium]